MAKSKLQIETIIPSAGTDSAVVTVPYNATLLGIHLPASMTGTSLKFKASKNESATAFVIKKDDGSADYSITIGSAAAYHPIDANIFEGVEFLTVVSGSAEGAARTLALVFGLN